MKPTTIFQRAWFILCLRLGLFAVIQAGFAGFFWLTGAADAWNESANWWPLVVSLVNLVCLSFLLRFYRLEGGSYWEIFRIHRDTLGKDLLVMLGVLVLTGPISYLPNVTLGAALFGDPAATLDLFIRPMPLWAAWAAVVIFPLTQGMVEIPAYMVYALPRLEKGGYAPWLAVAITTLFLSSQHALIPLLFDGRFLVWRLFMFLPFALFVAVVMRWRPRLLPYFAIVHVLMDAATALMLVLRAY